MESIKKLYNGLWEELIKPRRIPYSEFDMGNTIISDNCTAFRLDFQLQNALHELFYMSIYFPCDKNNEVPNSLDFVVYCHTHNASRVEGLVLMEKLLSRGMALVVFDFRANGFSTGKYVTLGWLEALDINEVCKFLKKEARANTITLWGRSMGACAAIFFLSPAYRKNIDAVLARQGKKVNWINPRHVDCLILDSPFATLTSTIHELAKVKVSKAPEWVVNIAIKLVDNEIKKKAGISVTKINPGAHVDKINTPTHLILGNDDYMVNDELFFNMHKSFGSKIKRITMFQGTHNEERSEDLQIELITFIKHIQALRGCYISNRDISLTGASSHGLNTSNYLDYTKSRLHENFDKKLHKVNLVTQHRAYIPINQAVNVIPPKKQEGMREPEQNLEDVKNVNILKKFNFNTVPINFNVNVNQFDARQIRTEGDSIHAIDSKAVKELLAEHSFGQDPFDLLDDSNNYKIGNINVVSSHLIQDLSFDGRPSFLKTSPTRIEAYEHRNMENKRMPDHFATTKIPHMPLKHHNTISLGQLEPFEPNRVFVPQYENMHQNTGTPIMDHKFIRANHPGTQSSETLPVVQQIHVGSKFEGITHRGETHTHGHKFHNNLHHAHAHFQKHDNQHRQFPEMEVNSDRGHMRTKTEINPELINEFFIKKRPLETSSGFKERNSERRLSYVETKTVYVNSGGRISSRLHTE